MIRLQNTRHFYIIILHGRPIQIVHLSTHCFIFVFLFVLISSDCIVFHSVVGKGNNTQIIFLINYVVLLLICRVIAVFPPPPAVGKIQILKMDLETLEDGKEVNDSVVDLFLM